MSKRSKGQLTLHKAPNQFGMRGLGKLVNLKKVTPARKIPEISFLWETSEGLKMRICDMATPHLLNAIALVRRGESIGKNGTPTKKYEEPTNRVQISDNNFIKIDGQLVGRIVAVIHDRIVMSDIQDENDMDAIRRNAGAIQALIESGKPQAETPAVEITTIRFKGDNYGESHLKEMELDLRDIHYLSQLPIYAYMILDAARRGFQVIE